MEFSNNTAGAWLSFQNCRFRFSDKQDRSIFHTNLEMTLENWAIQNKNEVAKIYIILKVQQKFRYERQLNKNIIHRLLLSDWISRQKWSNGNVGMYGKSWGGFNGLQTAFMKPPALKAVISCYSTGQDG